MRPYRPPATCASLTASPQAKRLPVLALAALGLCLTADVAQAATPQTLYYERVLMGEAGGRCGLFAANVRASLAAGAAQARGAASAAGETQVALDATAARARSKADAVACASPELHIAAQRVRAAFLVWSHQRELILPGRRGLWRARRATPATAGWALVESARIGGAPMAFGLTLRGASATVDAEPAAVIAPAQARGAYAARLVLRDPARAPEPYLARDGEPPASASRVFIAQARSPADPALLAGGGVLFRFPAAAVDALAALDGRESARVELVYSGPEGERVASTMIEAGDFATGRAFLAAGR